MTSHWQFTHTNGGVGIRTPVTVSSDLIILAFLLVELGFVDRCLPLYLGKKITKTNRRGRWRNELYVCGIGIGNLVINNNAVSGKEFNVVFSRFNYL
jgi:hypothetical protein